MTLSTKILRWRHQNNLMSYRNIIMASSNKSYDDIKWTLFKTSQYSYLQMKIKISPFLQAGSEKSQISAKKEYKIPSINKSRGYNRNFEFLTSLQSTGKRLKLLFVSTFKIHFIKYLKRLRSLMDRPGSKQQDVINQSIT